MSQTQGQVSPEDGQIKEPSKPEDADDTVQAKDSPFVEELWIGSAVRVGDCEGWVEEQVRKRQESHGCNCKKIERCVGADGISGVLKVPVRHYDGTGQRMSKEPTRMSCWQGSP